MITGRGEQGSPNTATPEVWVDVESVEFAAILLGAMARRAGGGKSSNAAGFHGNDGERRGGVDRAKGVMCSAVLRAKRIQVFTRHDVTVG